MTGNTVLQMNDQTDEQPTPLIDWWTELMDTPSEPEYPLDRWWDTTD